MGFFDDVFHHGRQKRKESESAEERRRESAAVAATQSAQALAEYEALKSKIIVDNEATKKLIEQGFSKRVATIESLMQESENHYESARQKILDDTQHGRAKVLQHHDIELQKLYQNFVADLQEVVNCLRRLRERIYAVHESYGTQKISLEVIWQQMQKEMLSKRCYNILQSSQNISVNGDIAFAQGDFSLLVSYLEMLYEDYVIDSSQKHKYVNFLFDLLSGPQQFAEKSGYNLVMLELQDLFFSLHKSIEQQSTIKYKYDSQNIKVVHDATEDAYTKLNEKAATIKIELEEKYEDAKKELLVWRERELTELERISREALEQANQEIEERRSAHLSIKTELKAKRDLRVSVLTSESSTLLRAIEKYLYTSLESIEEARQQRAKKITDEHNERCKQINRRHRAASSNLGVIATTAVAGSWMLTMGKTVKGILLKTVSSALLSSGGKALENLVNGKDEFGVSVKTNLNGNLEVDGTVLSEEHNEQIEFDSNRHLLALHERMCSMEDRMQSRSREITRDVFYQVGRAPELTTDSRKITRFGDRWVVGMPKSHSLPIDDIRISLATPVKIKFSVGNLQLKVFGPIGEVNRKCLSMFGEGIIYKVTIPKLSDAHIRRPSYRVVASESLMLKVLGWITGSGSANANEFHKPSDDWLLKGSVEQRLRKFAEFYKKVTNQGPESSQTVEKKSPVGDTVIYHRHYEVSGKKDFMTDIDNAGNHKLGPKFEYSVDASANAVMSAGKLALHAEANMKGRIGFYEGHVEGEIGMIDGKFDLLNINCYGKLTQPKTLSAAGILQSHMCNLLLLVGDVSVKFKPRCGLGFCLEPNMHFIVEAKKIGFGTSNTKNTRALDIKINWTKDPNSEFDLRKLLLDDIPKGALLFRQEIEDCTREYVHQDLLESRTLKKHFPEKWESLTRELEYPSLRN